jgi:hypothetical protein
MMSIGPRLVKISSETVTGLRRRRFGVNFLGTEGMLSISLARCKMPVLIMDVRSPVAAAPVTAVKGDLEEVQRIRRWQ